jgi:hypothetical protein
VYRINGDVADPAGINSGEEIVGEMKINRVISRSDPQTCLWLRWAHTAMSPDLLPVRMDERISVLGGGFIDCFRPIEPVTLLRGHLGNFRAEFLLTGGREKGILRQIHGNHAQA